jgi:NitT/TauT family transport system substrate-binding protein
MIEWLQRRGVDHKTLQFVEIPFPQMMDALLQNRLDCVWAVEPFLTLMNKTGKVRVLASPYQDNIPNMDLTAFFAKESWLKANPDVAIRFKRALQKGTDYLNQASNEERAELVAKYTGAKVELIREVNLPQFSREFDPPTLKANLDLAVAQKLVKPIEIDSVIWKQP